MVNIILGRINTFFPDSRAILTGDGRKLVKLRLGLVKNISNRSCKRGFFKERGGNNSLKATSGRH